MKVTYWVVATIFSTASLVTYTGFFKSAVQSVTALKFIYKIDKNNYSAMWK